MEEKMKSNKKVVLIIIIIFLIAILLCGIFVYNKYINKNYTVESIERQLYFILYEFRRTFL